MHIVENASLPLVSEYISRVESLHRVPTPSYKFDVFYSSRGSINSSLVSTDYSRCIGLLLHGSLETRLYHISEYILPSNGADRRDIAALKSDFEHFKSANPRFTSVIFGGYKRGLISLEYPRMLAATKNMLNSSFDFILQPKNDPTDVEDIYWIGEEIEALLIRRKKWNEQSLLA